MVTVVKSSRSPGCDGEAEALSSRHRTARWTAPGCPRGLATSTMRFFAYVLLAAAAVAGCGESAAPTLPPCLERGACVDPDAGVDGGVGGSGGIGGHSGSGGLGGSGGGVGGPWCTTSALCPACPDQAALCDADQPCAVGEVCLPTGCEDLSRCFVVGGGGCENDEDCGDPAYACNLSIERCLRIEPGCDDSNDCVAGFACEDNACFDRRVPCETGSDCPHGFTCFFASPDQRFCRRVTRPCTDDLDCLVLGVPCGNADDSADGSKECMPSLTPTAPDPISCDNTQCPDDAAPVCESSVEGTVAVCGRFGPCASIDDCPTGFQCRDLWGDGRQECALPPITCLDSSDCSPRTVCASPRTGGAPTCVGGAEM